MKFSSKYFKTIISVIILACAIGTVQAADDPVLGMLPGDCTFCVRINDLNGSLAKTDQYLTGVAPIGTAMLVNMQLAGIVGDPMLGGIEMNGNFVVIGLSDMTVALLVPVTNYAEFVKNNANCSEGEGGIAILASPNSPMGKFAMTDIAGGKYAIVVPEAEQAKLAGLKTTLTNPSASLAAKLNGTQSKEAAMAPVWGYVNLASMYEQFSPLVLSEMGKAETEMTAAMGGSMGEFGAFYVKLYMEVFKEFAGSADSATVALTPEPTALNLDISLRAKDGSELAQMIVADPKAKKGFAYTGYLDNNNAINGLMKVDPSSMQKMYDKMFDMMEKSNPNASMAEQVAKMKEITHKMMPTMGDEIAFSFSYAKGKPPFKLREVLAIKDMAAMEELMEESMGLAGDFYAAMGLPLDFQYQPAVSTYKDVTIDKMVLTFPPSEDPNDPMQAAIEQLYGGDLTYTMAHSADTFYVTMGADSEADVKTLIDQDAGAPATGEVKAAIDLLANTPYTDFVCSVNVIKLMTGMGDMMQSMGPMIQAGCEGEPSPMPDIFGGLDLPSQSSLAIGGYSTDGQCSMRLVMPKQHLMEIMSAAMQIQQKMMPPQPAPATESEAPSN